MNLFIIVTLFEILGVVAIIVGLFNEKKLIAWENKQFRKIKRYYRAVQFALEDCRR